MYIKGGGFKEGSGGKKVKRMDMLFTGNNWVSEYDSGNIFVLSGIETLYKV